MAVTITGNTRVIGQTTVGVTPTNLLDLYPNAAAAYSLRKLRSDYTGSCIRVRRSSDNAEQDIGFDSNGSLNETTLLAFVGANTGFVKTWYDQSINGINLTQTTLSYQPLIVNAGVVYKLNGKPYILKNNTVCFLQSSSFTVLSQPNTLFTLNSRFTNNVQYPFIFDGGTTNRNALFYNVGPYAIYAGTTQSISGSIVLGTEYITSNTFNSTNSVFFRNGTQIGTTYNIGTLGIDKITVFAPGDVPTAANTDYLAIKELIFYNSDQSSNRTGIEQNINAYYNIY